MLETKDVLQYSWLDDRLLYKAKDKTTREVTGYYQNGKLQFKFYLVNGFRQGVGVNYYDNGKICNEETYDRDILHGLRKEYCLDGTLRLQERYERGLLHRIRILYDEQGRISRKEMYVRGRRADPEFLEIINSRELEAADILKIGNSELRRACLEELGYERFLAELKHEIIDRKEDYELVKINWHKREEQIHLVKVKCPSTGAFYTLRVPPAMKTIKEAIAWTFGMEDKEYLPEQET